MNTNKTRFSDVAGLSDEQLKTLQSLADTLKEANKARKQTVEELNAQRLKLAGIAAESDQIKKILSDGVPANASVDGETALDIVLTAKYDAERGRNNMPIGKLEECVRVLRKAGGKTSEELKREPVASPSDMFTRHGTSAFNAAVQTTATVPVAPASAGKSGSVAATGSPLLIGLPGTGKSQAFAQLAQSMKGAQGVILLDELEKAETAGAGAQPGLSEAKVTAWMQEAVAGNVDKLKEMHAETPDLTNVKKNGETALDAVLTAKYDATSAGKGKLAEKLEEAKVFLKSVGGKLGKDVTGETPEMKGGTEKKANPSGGAQLELQDYYNRLLATQPKKNIIIMMGSPGAGKSAVLKGLLSGQSAPGKGTGQP